LSAANQAGEVVLSVEGVSLSFGGVKALQDVSFDVRAKEVRAIIGPNGAGKSSMLNVLNGVYHPQKGKIKFKQKEFADMDSHEAAALGIARTFQNIALFKGMTVLDNLLIGRHFRQSTGIVTGGLYYGPGERDEIAQRAVVEDIIDFLEIEHVRKAVVQTLSYGLQKRVELARALALEPRLLLLDEPMAGMNAEEKEDMARFILDINEERGTSILMIEHDMGVVMELSQRICVLDFGEVIAEGSPAEVQGSAAVQHAYLGPEAA
jgi:branched-chain amino acid transport system ATP-binding protein